MGSHCLSQTLKDHGVWAKIQKAPHTSYSALPEWIPAQIFSWMLVCLESQRSCTQPPGPEPCLLLSHLEDPTGLGYPAYHHVWKHETWQTWVNWSRYFKAAGRGLSFQTFNWTYLSSLESRCNTPGLDLWEQKALPLGDLDPKWSNNLFFVHNANRLIASWSMLLMLK